MTDNKELFKLAEKARERAYAPYSDITVGAALLSESGKIYLGANIENAAYSPSVCAERVALFTAIAEGERKFKAIAVAGGRRGERSRGEFAPCGVCRQVMCEFCDGNFTVIFGEDQVSTLSELMPHTFDEDSIK